MHDVMKSTHMGQVVENSLKSGSIQMGLKTCSAQRFSRLDHDAKLHVAMHVMGHEVEQGTDTQHDSVTRQFFAEHQINSGEHKPLMDVMKGMWGLKLNGLQLNQAKCHPEQLKPLLHQAANASGSEFKNLQANLKAYSIHELTDLLGAANPFLSLLPGPVINKASGVFDILHAEMASLHWKPATDINANAQ